MPSLVELKGEFIKFVDYVHTRRVKTLAKADGVMFLCPKCYAENKGPVGTHMVQCWFFGRVPDNATPGPGRWRPTGTGLKDLTFVGPDAFSVQIQGGCNWHGFVKDGNAD